MDQKNKKQYKAYGTSSVFSDCCMLKRDYSYTMDYNCLDCKFCYATQNKYDCKKIKLRTYKYFLIEKDYFPDMFKVPIVMSRFCDPFYSKGSTNNSIKIAREIFENNGQVILKTSQANIPEEMIELLSSNNKDCLVQLRIISDDSYTGNLVKDTLSPRFSYTKDMFKTAELLKSKNIDVSIFIDPYIIGLNSHLNKIIETMDKLDIRKLNIKQLFATEKFVRYLVSDLSFAYASLIKNKAGIYYTYNGIDFLKSLLPNIELCDKYNIDIGICFNKEVNKVICKNNNCCLINNPRYLYDITKNFETSRINGSVFKDEIIMKVINNA